ncbi:hypothetical protein IQ272_10055 [Chroococcidiopsidales cyanobacterium LEGE 13417]|nr:hypothetical protein [Chroococcidiopsidales cyanobacterium LEGE 13417]
MFGYIRTNSREYILTLDEVAVAPQAGYVFYFPDDESCSAVLNTSALYERMILLSPAEIFSSNFSRFRCYYPFLWEHEFDNFYIDYIAIYYTNNIYKLEIELLFDFDNWKQPWSMVEHGKEFKLVFDTQSLVDAECRIGADDLILNGYSVFFDIKSSSAPLRFELEEIISILNKVHEQTLFNLSSKVHSNTVTVQFNSPEEVKSACKQYLAYFTQFLRDVGIEATDELKEEADSVLFSVIPRDKEKALENIKIALEVYLRLPSIPTLNTSGFLETSIEEQRLSANIHHLRGQLVLASAIIQ